MPDGAADTLGRQGDDAVADRALERQGRRLAGSSRWLFLVGFIVAIPGIVMVIVGSGFVFGLGIALLAIGGGFGVVAAGLLIAGAVSRWAARRRLFA